MSKYSFSRWVAGVAVLAGIAFGVVVGSGSGSETSHVTEGEIVWTVGSSSSVLR
jgi:hypothetical protein